MQDVIGDGTTDDVQFESNLGVGNGREGENFWVFGGEMGRGEGACTG